MKLKYSFLNNQWVKGRITRINKISEKKMKMKTQETKTYVMQWKQHEWESLKIDTKKRKISNK